LQHQQQRFGRLAQRTLITKTVDMSLAQPVAMETIAAQTVIDL